MLILFGHANYIIFVVVSEIRAVSRLISGGISGCKTRTHALE